MACYYTYVFLCLVDELYIAGKDGLRREKPVPPPKPVLKYKYESLEEFLVQEGESLELLYLYKEDTPVLGTFGYVLNYCSILGT